MSKNDFRVNLPLWNIGLFFILMIWTYGIAYAIDAQKNDFQEFYIRINGVLAINWSHPAIIMTILGFVLLVVYLVAYSIKLRAFLQTNPNDAFSSFFVRPGELLEDDEMLRKVSEAATKKVYILYSSAVPLIATFIALIPLNRYVYVMMLFLLIIVHNAIYYYDIRKFISGNYKETNLKKKSDKKLANILMTCIVIGFLVAITITILNVKQVDKQQEEALEQFKACVDEGKTASINFEIKDALVVECK